MRQALTKRRHRGLRFRHLEDELHEDEWMWNEVDYDVNAGEALHPKSVHKGKEEEMARFKEMGVCEYVS